MTARLPAAAVAVGVAIAFAANAYALPELFVQLHDPNVLAAPAANALLHLAGNSAVAAFCGAFAGVAVLFSAWRAWLRGASWQITTVAAILCACCIAGRTGITFDPIAWFGASVVALVADTDDRRAWYALIPFVVLWELAENGATIALLIAVTATIGAFAGRRIEPRDVRARVFVCLAIAVAALAQPHLSPLRGYGIHWLYLDAFLGGAQRDRLLLSPLNVSGIGFFALTVLASWYGLRRRARTGDVLIFVALFLLTLCDTRNAPFFGIVGAPIVAEAITASGGAPARAAVDLASLTRAVAIACTCAVIFTAAIAFGEPRIARWRASPEVPVSLLHDASAKHARVVLCERPRWCDDAPAAGLLPVLDDRAGLSTVENRTAQARAARVRGKWRSALDAARVDAAVASSNEALATLLSAGGWTVAARDSAGRVLLLRGAR